MATETWTSSGYTGDFDAGSSWQGGTAPQPGDTANMLEAGTATLSVSKGDVVPDNVIFNIGVSYTGSNMGAEPTSKFSVGGETVPVGFVLNVTQGGGSEDGSAAVQTFNLAGMPIHSTINWLGTINVGAGNSLHMGIDNGSSTSTLGGFFNNEGTINLVGSGANKAIMDLGLDTGTNSTTGAYTNYGTINVTDALLVASAPDANSNGVQTGSGTINLASSAYTRFAVNTVGTKVSFKDATDTLAIGSGATDANPQVPAAFGGTITGFQAGDKIAIGNVGTFVQGSLAYANGTLTFSTSTGAAESLKISGNYSVGNFALSNSSSTEYPNEIDVATNTVCFASGTRILTVRGDDTEDVAVEQLTVGDLVVSVSGGRQAIRWLGHRTVDCRSHPKALRPVRIAAHAFGEGRPSRDLRVSPGHAICVDLEGEVLIPAGSLINGATVTQDEVDRITYWHVELDSHDILLAEGLPAESYLDCGNRAWFAGFAGLIDPDRAIGSPVGFCRPFVPSGPPVAVCRARLAAQAEALGWTATGDMDLHAVVNGHRVEPTIEGDLACLLIPPGAKTVEIVSATFRPSWWAGAGTDDRDLGLHLQSLRVLDGFGRSAEIVIDDAALAHGLHHRHEAANDEPARWTNARLRLDAHLWAHCRGPLFLQLRISQGTGRRWIPPAGKAEMDTPGAGQNAAFLRICAR